MKNTLFRMIVITLSIIVSACAGDNVRMSAADDEDRDIGLGGTGLIAGLDSGLGGTGIVGEITGFGSIFVNGIEIEYHEGTPVTVNGQLVDAPALHIGDVVEVLTTDSSKHTQAMRINVRHEVIGKVTAVDNNSPGFSVLGQTIIMPDNAVSLPEPGTMVAVSGFRIDESRIRATRVIRVDGRNEFRSELLREGMELPYSSEVNRWLIQASVSEGHVAVDVDGITRTVPLGGEDASNDQVGDQGDDLAATGIVELYQSAAGVLTVRKVIDPVTVPRGRQVITPGRTAGSPGSTSMNPLRTAPGSGSAPGSTFGSQGGAVQSGPGPSRSGAPTKMQYRY
jgi:hypothetical protein